MTRARDLADIASSGVIEGTERADFALVYYDTNQGWLLKEK